MRTHVIIPLLVCATVAATDRAGAQLASAATATAAGNAAPASAITCLAPLSGACEVQVSPGEEVRVPINLRVPSDSGKVAFTSDACCVEPAVVDVGPTGVVSATFKGRFSGRDPVRVQIHAAVGTPVPTGEITLVPRHGTGYRLRQEHAHPYAWFRNQQMPGAIRLIIETPPDPRACEDVQVAVSGSLGGQVAPTAARGRWIPADTVCAVDVNWQLADMVGEQHLDAHIVGAGPGADTAQVQVTAYARHLPRIWAGVAYVSAGGGSGAGMEPLVSLDFPLFSTASCRYKVCHNIRPMVGALFDEPERNYFVGVLLLPMVTYERESLPIQIGAGMMNHGRYVVSLSADAGGLFTSFLKNLGAPL